MISECLRKEPDKRPSAKLLLKNDFFKKSKDKAYLVKALLSEGAPVVPQKVKHVPGASGRLHKNEDGEWEWSDEEEAPAENEHKPKPPMLSSTEPVAAPAMPAPAQTSSNNAQMNEPAQCIYLVLRLRNEHKELNDIKFEFTPGEDTSDSVARELVEAGLVDGRDMIVVAANLQKILDHSDLRNLVFALNSGCTQHEVPDDKALVGFAQLSLIDPSDPEAQLDSH